MEIYFNQVFYSSSEKIGIPKLWKLKIRNTIVIWIPTRRFVCLCPPRPYRPHTCACVHAKNTKKSRMNPLSALLSRTVNHLISRCIIISNIAIKRIKVLDSHIKCSVHLNMSLESQEELGICCSFCFHTKYGFSIISRIFHFHLVMVL